MHRVIARGTPFVRCLLISCLLTMLHRPAFCDQNDCASDPVRVMSFNVRHGDADDGDNHWDKRKHVTLAAIQNYEPDLLGTQEIVMLQVDYLKRHLPEYTYVGRGRLKEPTPFDEHCGVFFKTDRFTLLKHGHLWLSEQPEQPGSKSWDSSLPRMLTWLHLKDRRSHHEFTLANTHFDHRGERARAESARILKSQAALWSRQGPVIITGDFNAAVGSPPYQTLFAADPQPRLTDTFASAHPGRIDNTGTFGGFRGIKTGPRIDWIAASSTWRVQSASIVHLYQESLYPSDHYPVTAVLCR